MEIIEMQGWRRLDIDKEGWVMMPKMNEDYYKVF